LREARQIGAGRFEPFHLGIAADAYSLAGHHPEARASIAKAFAALALGHHRAFAAELYRTRAMLQLRGDAGERAAAEADLRRALQIARERRRRRLSCGRLVTSRGCWPRAASGGRRGISWPRSMAGSPRVSARQT
jgi:hypothetical protein